MGEQGGGRQAFGDRSLWRWRLMDGPAGPAAIARPADTNDPQPRRNVVEHLADRLADLMQRATTAGASLALDVQPDVLAWQVGRQARPLRLRFAGFGLDRREPGFDPCQIDLEVLKPKM